MEHFGEVALKKYTNWGCFEHWKISIITSKSSKYVGEIRYFLAVSV